MHWGFRRNGGTVTLRNDLSRCITMTASVFRPPQAVPASSADCSVSFPDPKVNAGVVIVAGASSVPSGPSRALSMSGQKEERSMIRLAQRAAGAVGVVR